jgi:hypothetical protein
MTTGSLATVKDVRQNMMLCISKHNNEYKPRKNTRGGWAGGLLLYSGQLSVAICIGSHAWFGLGRWAGCLEELVVQNALHVVVSAVGQHKTGRLIVD